TQRGPASSLQQLTGISSGLPPISSLPRDLTPPFPDRQIRPSHTGSAPQYPGP
ncbi:unnamed protein product, partial [Lampetra planeri]